MNTLEENFMQDVGRQEVERKPYSSDSMRVRCPECRKLYLVQFNDVKESKPRFECVQCRTRFWLSLPDMDLTAELVGLPIQVKESPVVKPRREGGAGIAGGAGGAGTPTALGAPVETKPCPKCFKPVPIGSLECTHCGVVLAKVKELNFEDSPQPPPHSENLAMSWKRVMAGYNDETVHAEFLRMAQRERNIVYAGAQYNQMLKLMPTDEITQKKVKEIQALAAVMIPPVVKKVYKRRGSRVWQIPLLASALMVLFGMLFPVFRNMVGVGAAFFFIAAAMQLQSRRR